MNVYLKFLQLQFRGSTELIEFERTNFFWGKIGAGKSSIARLIDYCLGGDIQLTPALQSEFIQAGLGMTVGSRDVTIYRQRESGSVMATWLEDDSVAQVVLPARRSGGVVIPETTVEVLSDLIFHLANVPIPLVRKGRKDGEQRMERLSFRDVYRFCYVDQDDIDSDFFRLDGSMDAYRRAKSVDSMRLFLGYHQERVAALESDLQNLHDRRQASKAAAAALERVLKDSGFENAIDIDLRVERLRAEAEAIRADGVKARQKADAPQEDSHAVDTLREKARQLSHQIQGYEEQLDAVRLRLRQTGSLVNELKMLTIRYSRTKTSRAVLAAVEFADCPRCNQHLPQRAAIACVVCGQEETHETGTHEHLSEQVLQNDLRARLRELQETQTGLETQEGRTVGRLESSKRQKALVDHSLNERLREYDSAFLSQAIEIERRATTVEQRVNALLTFKQFPEKLDAYFAEVEELLSQEADLKETLKAARSEAFKDTANIELLETLFLDCLVRAKFPGITPNHVVTIDRRSFWPEVMPRGEEDIAVTSYANMGSGGMKCIFKACFALALHRLAVGRETALPSLLVIDSVMKNMSERENLEIFESFYTMVYELADTELRGTQFIIIDKELFPPYSGFNTPLKLRHMMPGSTENPPLIPYYLVPQARPSEDVGTA